MNVFEWIVGLMTGAVILSAVARRIGVPYPALLAVGGAVIALLPMGPRLTLEPSLALALFVAPVLLDAAFDASPRDLRDNWLAVGGLVVVAVGVTTAAVACVGRWLTPEMGWAPAVALGAIVAPPDAAAAMAVLRQVRPPHRVLVILEGESLLNDASALLIYRVALAAAVSHEFRVAHVVPTFLLVVVGSVVFGIVLARFYMRLIARVSDPPSSVVLQFSGTFGTWMLAERLHLSGVLTIVAFAMHAAQSSPNRTPARLRVPSYAVWDTAVFVLNVLAFLMIGLQIRPILERASGAQHLDDLRFALAILVTVIAVRIAWVMIYAAVVRLSYPQSSQCERPLPPPTAKGAFIVSWCGMRGIVTLAAALALPYDPGAFPYRDRIVLTAFVVVVGTLVVQGTTLRPLLSWLKLEDDRPVEREVALARTRTMKAALDSLDGDRSPEADALRREYRAVLEATSEGPNGATIPQTVADHLRLRAVAAGRETLSDLRARGEIGDDAFHRIEEELDRLELSAERP